MYWLGDVRCLAGPSFIHQTRMMVFTYKFWQLSVFGDVLNAVHGVNPEFTLYNYDYTESAVIAGLPIFPSVGFQLEVNL